MKNELKRVAEYAKRHGYTVSMEYNHVVATNANGAVRTASMETIKKVCSK